MPTRKALAFLLVFLVPALMPAAAWLGARSGRPDLMAWFPLFFLFVLLPLADYAVGHDPRNPAAADVAATLAPDYVGALAKPLGLVRRRILSPEVMRYVCLYSPARRATSPAAEGFADHLIRILAQRK